MNALLTPDEPLSPELVLVLPPELRAQALARLLAPVWAQPQARVLAAPSARYAVTRTLGRIVVSRAAQLAQIFLAITILILAMSVIANAIR